MTIEKWRVWRPKEHPYIPPDYDEDVVMALRALETGTANAGQQETAMRWMRYVTGVGEFSDLSFRPGGPDAERESAFAEGKRFVGLQLQKMLHPATLEAVTPKKVVAGRKRGATKT